MQSTTIMAFRKRLKSYGYTEISITQVKDRNGRRIPGRYTVRAIEPLGKELIIVEYTTEKMHHTFR